MGVPPAKLHEKPAEANKSGTEGEQKAGFFDPVKPVHVGQIVNRRRIVIRLPALTHPFE
jgi:hypothetical protein